MTSENQSNTTRRRRRRRPGHLSLTRITGLLVGGALLLGMTELIHAVDGASMDGMLHLYRWAALALFAWVLQPVYQPILLNWLDGFAHWLQTNYMDGETDGE